MYVRFWGTRGSIAKAGPSTLRFGGNTSCVEVRSAAGTIVVLDCGTGAHGLGKELAAEAGGEGIAGNILISHTHWDHIQGLPFFEPLFHPEGRWQIYGPSGLGSSLGETLSGQMQYSYFPVSLEQMGGVVDYHDLVEGTFELGDIRVTTHYLNHPALTLGYRLEADGATVVYASDHEPHHRGLATGGDIGVNDHDRAHADFLRGADLVIHDTQYRAEEYEQRVGWGHSTMEYVVDVARHAGVGSVALFHHDPARTDDQVDELLEAARAYAGTRGYDGEVLAAAEGARIDVVAGSAERTAAAVRPFVATDTPALEDVHRSVLVAVRDPAIKATVREAVAAEEVEYWEAEGRDEVLELARAHEPALVLIEDDGSGMVAELATAIRSLDRPSGGDVTVVAVGGSGVHRAMSEKPGAREWMVWPASARYVRTKLRAWLLRRACRWQNAPLPDDEDARLAGLRALGVLDTAPEDRFDQITAAASAVLDVPVALVSLVDEERQWFKSRHGIDVTETPRDLSLCAHAILGDDVLHVPDALEDSRFAENPIVADDPRVRFYAGVPLTTSDGTRAGTLCVLDFRPRFLDADQLAELRRLGDLATTELERG